jgi:ferredoxin
VKIDENIFLGCGVCVRVCPSESLMLRKREKRIITPVDSIHKAVIMAVERGKLQNLVFDNHLLFSHRAMAAVMGAVLKLPPMKQLMASQQLKSRYLERLIRRYKLKNHLN